MCSIYGAIGAEKGSVDLDLLADIAAQATDRGRDGGRHEEFKLGKGRRAWLGNWRATPTPETRDAPLQPYGGIVHNGTIANDVELGGQPGDVDSMILPKVLDRFSVSHLRDSLQKVMGSYALAAVAKDTVLLARNYKPLYILRRGDAVYFSSMERHFQDAVQWGEAAMEMPAYSVCDLWTGETAALPRKSEKRAVVIASAGLDSTCVAAELVKKGHEVCLLHFRYGCKAEANEAELIPQIAERLDCEHHFLDIDYSHMRGSSPLLKVTDQIATGVEGAEFAHEWVPARNFLMLAHAAAYAEANGYHTIALGNNLEESGAYPDNEEEMTNLLDRAMNYAVSDGYNLRIVSPVGHLMKHEIVKLGLENDAPFDLTWSCYRRGTRHCGNCGPCFMRREAFERNAAIDPVFACDHIWEQLDENEEICFECDERKVGGKLA